MLSNAVLWRNDLVAAAPLNTQVEQHVVVAIILWVTALGCALTRHPMRMPPSARPIAGRVRCGASDGTSFCRYTACTPTAYCTIHTRMCRVYSGFRKLLCEEQPTTRSKRDHDSPCRGPWLRASGAPHRRIPCPIWLYARLMVTGGKGLGVVYRGGGNRR